MKWDLFEKTEKRLYYMDIVRFFAIFFMVLSHVELMYANDKFYNSVLGAIIDGLAGPPAAPVFMVTMGFFMIYTGKTDVTSGLKRGAKIFFIGIMLNVVRYILPGLIKTWMTGEPHIVHSTDMVENLLYLFWEVDILLFAGLAYGLTILLVQYKPKIVLPAVFFTVAICAPFLWGISTDNLVADLFLDLLWGDESHVAFPQFPWLCYPILGAWIAILFQEAQGSDERPKTGKKIFLVGVLLIVIGGIITIFDLEGQLGDYYRTGTGATLLFSGFVIVWLIGFLNVMHWFKGHVKPLIQFVSANLTSIYCIHWSILGWLILALELNNYGGTVIFGLFAIVFPVSVLLSKYIRIKI